MGKQCCGGGEEAGVGILEQMYTVGSVPYLNARPLVRYLHDPSCRLPVKVVYDVPSKLPALLETGEADAVLASSIEALNTGNRKVAGGLCIASNGTVLSVRLFSKVPPRQIKTLALDQSSLTSNALARIVLAERFETEPTGSPLAPDLNEMLSEHDACILIGDIGMRTDGEGLHVLDLGEEWKELTGLPFVWALWIGSNNLTPELAGMLNVARVMSFLGAPSSSSPSERQKAIIKKLLGPFEFDEQIALQRSNQLAAISAETGWSVDQVRRYLSETIIFDLAERELEGLRRFQEMLQKRGYAEAKHFPEIVAPKSDPALPYGSSLSPLEN